MGNRRAATRYAKSLLELAIEFNKLEEVHEDMRLFSKVVEENRVLEVLLKNPIITHEKKRTILIKVFHNHVDKLTMSAFDLITRKNRENILLLIAQEFIIQYNLSKGYQEARVVTTFKLDDTLKEEFEALINRISNKEAKLEEKVDKDILGGFILTVGDKRIDSSVKSKLALIHRELTA